MTTALAAGLAAALLWLGAARVDPRLAWLVCAPLVASCMCDERRRPTLGQAAAAGASFALAAALAGHATWLAEAGERYFALAPGPAIELALALCAATALPAGLALGLALGCAGRLPPGWIAPASAAVWTVWESLTRITFPYYPWVGLAATQAADLPALQAASVAGAPGLALLVAGSGAAVGIAARRIAVRGRRGALAAVRAGGPPLACAAALAAATSAAGRLRLAAAEAHAAPAAARCSIAAVDGDVASTSLGEADVLARYARGTERASRNGPAAVVWPESALQRDPILDPALQAELRAIASRAATALIVGGPRTEWDASWQPHRTNSLFRVASDGPIATYDKRALVPFAEIWPETPIAKPAWLDVESLRGGSAPAVMRAGACRLGVLICFEAERPALARELVALGADAIAIASNDAELPARAIATEVDEARLRAVETGLPVLRAANRGALLALDRYGRDAATPEAGVALLPVPAPDPAPAVRWTTPLLVLCGIGAAIAVVTGARRSPER